MLRQAQHERVLGNCHKRLIVCYAEETEGASKLRRSPILLCLALAACGPYPRDNSGTLDRIEQSGRLRIGVAELRAEDEPAARRFITRIERATGARAGLVAAPLEAQLVRLEEGELDLVIGEFDENTPWMTPVAIIEPLSTRREGKRVLELAPVARNGENRWIALVEREVRDMAEQGGR